jgi:hypothetical protein
MIRSMSLSITAKSLTIDYRFGLAGIERCARYFLEDEDACVRAKAEETLKQAEGKEAQDKSGR